MATLDVLDGLSPTEAAIQLRVSRTRIDQLIRSGDLDVILTPIGRVIDRASLERLTEQRQRKFVGREAVIS